MLLKRRGCLDPNGRRQRGDYDPEMERVDDDTMSLEASQLDELMFGRRPNVEIGYVPESVRAHLGSAVGAVYLSKPTLDKIIRKHADVGRFDMLFVSQLLRVGQYFADRPGTVVAFGTRADDGRLYRAVVKVAAKCEIWLSTFHRANVGQLRKAQATLARIV